MPSEWAGGKKIYQHRGARHFETITFPENTGWPSVTLRMGDTLELPAGYRWEVPECLELVTEQEALEWWRENRRVIGVPPYFYEDEKSLGTV